MIFRHGWFKIAFADDIPWGLSRVALAGRSVLIVQNERGMRAFDDVCPHRGASLSLGGRLEADCVVCPFHGYRIGLGDMEGDNAFRVREYPLVVLGPMVLLRLSNEFEHGFTDAVASLTTTHVFVRALHLTVHAPGQLVIENGFDSRHFNAVHGVSARNFAVSEDTSAGLRATAIFSVPYRFALDGQPLVEPSHIPYDACAFSPGLILVRLGGENPYAVITGATDNGNGGCDVRLTFALPRSVYGDSPDPASYQALVDYSRAGIEADHAIWENLAVDFEPHWVAADGAGQAFQAYCRDFT